MFGGGGWSEPRIKRRKAKNKATYYSIPILNPIAPLESKYILFLNISFYCELLFITYGWWK